MVTGNRDPRLIYTCVLSGTKSGSRAGICGDSAGRYRKESFLAGTYLQSNSVSNTYAGNISGLSIPLHMPTSA